LLTFAEFEQLPEPQGARLELRHGEPTPVPPPKWKHLMMERRLRSLLAAVAAGAGIVETEVGSRVSATEFRIADVAFICSERAERADPDGYFEGAPDLVIEVLSPSNTAMEMLEKEALCLENGAREFWLVDMDRRQVRVSMQDGHSITYKSGQQIPLMFGGSLPVDAIFS
jgi:Uma2 family endonuclease